MSCKDLSAAWGCAVGDGRILDPARRFLLDFNGKGRKCIGACERFAAGHILKV